MKKSSHPHWELGSLMEVTRQLRMAESAGFGINALCRSAGIGNSTFYK